MRVALISDLHANWQALQSLTADLALVDQIICLGDVVGYYCEVNEVITWVRDHCALCVRGNHDDYLVRGYPPDTSEAVRFGIDYADRVIDPDHRSWLASLPVSWGGLIGTRSLLIVHGSPWRPLTDYLYANNPRVAQLDEFDYDVLAFGQTHRAYQRLDGRPMLVNPGSIGQSRSRPSQACAAILDTATLRLEFIERSYSGEDVISKAKACGAGDWVTKHLL